MKKILISGIIAFLVSSCISLNQFIVTPLGDEPAGYSQRFVYSLPQTVLEVRVDFEKNIYLPGPYRQFTEKFLGMSQYIKEEKRKWEITGISVLEFCEPDPLQYFSVNLLRGSFQANSYFDLASQGLVIDPMGAISSNVILPVKNQAEIAAVLELSMKKNHKEKTDTLFKTIITDSSFVKVPILRKQKEAKTIEQKAEEAANLIIKIRKRRLKLVSGEYELFPEGKALEIAIEELNKTEQEYIALFIGKIYTGKFSRSYFIVPAGSSQEIVVMRFSENDGIISNESNEGQPVTIVMNPLEGFPLIFNANEQTPKNSFYYRVPSTCYVRISEGDDLLYEGRISVFQAGSLLLLPTKKKKVITLF